MIIYYLKSFFVLYLLFIGYSINAQSDNRLINLPEFYQGSGVIFIDTSTIGLQINNLKCWFIPSFEEIKESETVLKSQYNILLKDYYVGQNKQYPLSSENKKNQEKLLKHSKYKKLKFHNRQYVGYSDTNNNKYVIMILLYFKNKRNEKKYFKNWRNILMLGFGEFYEKNEIVFKVELEKHNLSFL